MMKFILPLVLAFSLFLIAFSFLAKQKVGLSPQKNQQAVNDISQKTPKHIVGFLPYWQLTSIDTIDFSPFSEIIYFGLHTNEKGEIIKEDINKFAAQFTKLVSTKKNISLSVVLQDNEKVENFLKDEAAQDRLIASISSLIAQYSITGINLDFEYAGIPGKETIASYTNFATALVKELKTHHPSLIVSVDVTADAMRKSRLYDVGALANEVDYIILMGYDFYRPTSSVAGPVAPLTGKELYEYDVTTAVSDFLTVVPKEKLILGVPYYGWDFPTADDQKGSFIEKRQDESVALASYKRTKQLIEGGNVDIRYDSESQTPWLIYHDPDTDGIRQIWYEDEKSLAKKYDLVNKENLAGVAIWALGYDGTHTNLANLLKEKFRR